MQILLTLAIAVVPLTISLSSAHAQGTLTSSTSTAVLDNDGFDPASLRQPELDLNFGQAILQMIIMLVAVCMLAYLLLGKLLPKLMQLSPETRRSMLATHQGEMIHVVDRLPLGPRRVMMVVRVGEEHFLVGMTDQGMTMLSRLDMTAEEPKPTESALGAFAKILRRKSEPEQNADSAGEGE